MSKRFRIKREHFPYISYFDTLMYRMVQAQMVHEDIMIRKSRGEFYISDDENDIGWSEQSQLAHYLQEEFINNLHEGCFIKDENAKAKFEVKPLFESWTRWFAAKKVKFLEVSNNLIEFEFYADFGDPSDKDWDTFEVTEDNHAKVHVWCQPGFLGPSVRIEMETDCGHRVSNVRGRMSDDYDYGDVDFLQYMANEVKQALMQHVRNEKVQLLDKRYVMSTAKKRRQAADRRKKKEQEKEA